MIIIIVIMMMMIMVIIMIIIIALCVCVCVCFTVSSLRRKPSPTCTLKWPRRNRVQITRSTSRAHHVLHDVCHAVRQDSQLLNLTELNSHLF